MKILNTYKYILLFFLIGIIVYFPMLLNGFAWDDHYQILNNTQLHSISVSIFFDNIFNNGTFYRQFTPLYLSVLYTFFQDNPFPYHLMQLLFHCSVSYLLFLLLKNYFKRISAFFLSLVFLIHPINAEAVVWISAIHYQAFMIFGLSGLLLLHKRELDDKGVILSSILLFLSLISYEGGILFFILASAILWQNKSLYLKNVLLLQFFALIFYFYLRILGGIEHYTFFHGSPLGPITFIEKIYTIPSILFYYLKTVLFPIDLMIWQYWTIKEFSLLQVFLPATSIILLFVLLIRFIMKLQANRQRMIFFTLWFLVGMSTLLQIMPLDMTVGDRFFYFPLMGLLGIIGCMYEYSEKKLSNYKIAILILMILLITLYSIRTFIRTFDWKSTNTLYLHDLQYEPRNIYLNYSMAHHYAATNQHTKAIEYFKKVIAEKPTFKFSLDKIAGSYEAIGDYEKALYYYNRSFNEIPDSEYPEAYDRYYYYGNCLFKAGKYNEILTLITDQKIENSPRTNDLRFLRAKANYELKNSDQAFKDAEYLYKNTNISEYDAFYKKLKELGDL